MQMKASPLYQRRMRTNLVGLALSMGAMVLGLVALLWILFVLFSNGLAALEPSLFTQDTPAPGSEGGGLRNAIVGSLMIVGLAVLCPHRSASWLAFTSPNTATPAKPPSSPVL
jgi:phosphate transport system permease protein